MCAESNTNENPTVGLAEEISPRSPWRVTSVETLPEFQLRIVFADGTTGTVDMARLVHSPEAGVFAVLLDPVLFALARVEYGAVSWPGELDLAPDAMHAAIREHGVWLL